MGPRGPSNHIVEWTWSWPCRISSTPYRFSTAGKGAESIRRLYLGDDGVQHLAPMDELAVAPPVERAQRPLAGQFAQAQDRQWRQVRVGQMGEHERRHHASPPGIPAEKCRFTIASCTPSN